MEYEVKLNSLLEGSEELESVVKAQRQAIEELHTVYAALQPFSGMDDVRHRIQRQLATMEEQLQVMLALMQAVLRIHQIYGKMENQVLDNLEQGNDSSLSTGTVFYSVTSGTVSLHNLDNPVYTTVQYDAETYACSTVTLDCTDLLADEARESITLTP